MEILHVRQNVTYTYERSWVYALTTHTLSSASMIDTHPCRNISNESKRMWNRTKINSECQAFIHRMPAKRNENYTPKWDRSSARTNKMQFDMIRCCVCWDLDGIAKQNYVYSSVWLCGVLYFWECYKLNLNPTKSLNAVLYWLNKNKSMESRYTWVHFHCEILQKHHKNP